MVETKIRRSFFYEGKHLNELLTYDDLKRLSEGTISASVNVIDGALEKANLLPTDIDMILLVGGSSQLPQVREKIEEKMGKQPLSIPKDLMLAVAKGAALYSKEISSLPMNRREKQILGNSLGVEVNDGGRRINKRLLNYDAELPATARYFLPLKEHQSEVLLNLVTLRGTSDNTEKKLQARKIRLSKDAKEIAINIKVDENRVITLEVFNPASPKETIAMQINKDILSDGDVDSIRKKYGILPEKTNRVLTGEEPCIGIDIGTTTSEMVYVYRTTKDMDNINNPDTPEKYNNYSFPSVVYFKDGRNDIQVASKMADDALGDASLSGQVFSSFKIQDWNKILGHIDNQNVTVQELTAHLIAKIWQTAKNDKLRLLNLKSAVITIPAGFDSDQCQYLINAAKIAGIENVSLIDEPTAAFYYYKEKYSENLNGVKYVLVFDFGGGTTDVAILDVSSDTVLKEGYKDSIFKVLATNSNLSCGGRNIDKSILNEIKKRFEDKNGVILPDFVMNRILRECENAKVVLASN